MSQVGLLVRLQAKPGKEAEVARLLEGGLQLVQEERSTLTWFAVRLAPATFAIFDTFPDDAARQAHLRGRLAAALLAKAGELLSQPPDIGKFDVLALKLPK